MSSYLSSISLSTVPRMRALTQLQNCRRHPQHLSRCNFSFIGTTSRRPAILSFASAFHSIQGCKNTNSFLEQSPQYNQLNYQKRNYRISLTKDDSNSGQSNVVVDDNSALLAQKNVITRRLYRILLKSCRNGVEIANHGNSIDGASINNYGKGVKLTCEGNSKKDNGNLWILLQPPMDHRKYGFAKIVRARRDGETTSLDSDESSSPKSLTTTPPTSSTNPSSTSNSVIGTMSKHEIGMAMEVLKFVHVSLGGDATDDLEEYYLGVYDTNEEESNDEEKGDLEKSDEVKNKGAAIPHSEGHYTQFLDEDHDEDEEDQKNDKNKDKTEGNDDDDKDNWQEDEEEYEYETEDSVLVTSNDLQNAVRIAFRAPLTSPSQTSEDEFNNQDFQTIIQRRHRDAIDVSSLLSEQLNAWADKSSISIDWERGVRIVATSHCLRKSSTLAGGAATKSNRFAYRIRVENISDWIADLGKQEEKVAPSENKETADASLNEKRAVQLLGRSWRISECGPWPMSSSSLLSRLLEDRAIASENKSKGGNNEQDQEGDCKVIQIVNEPKTGAVGHLPVLRPGEVFEYMSGADISTHKGAMEGCFHMALVDDETTDSAHVGDPVEALSWKSNDERIFEMPVGRFGLRADEEEDI